MPVACNLIYDDDSVSMTVAQLFTYIRHRYADLQACFFRDRDVLAIPLSDDTEETLASIRELAVRKGLTCCEVSAAWPELAGPELAGFDGASEFLVISMIRGKYLQT
jgi:hypothetical protein